MTVKSRKTERLDPNLPFYYHTSTHKRFSEGQLPNFSDAPKKPRQQYASRRELLTHNIGGRVSLAQCGATSIRTQYHNVPVELPPPLPYKGTSLNILILPIDRILCNYNFHCTQKQHESI